MRRRLPVWICGLIGLCGLINGCSSISARMGRGQLLYRAKCSSCHMLIRPERHTPEQWSGHVELYGERLTNPEKEQILRYLTGEDPD